jgi:hypothetical protein
VVDIYIYIYIYIIVYLDRLNVGGTFDQVMDIDGYAILFELYYVK